MFRKSKPQKRRYFKSSRRIRDEAYLAKRAKNVAEAKDYYQKAFDLEKEAAMLLVTDYEIEPTRSVLFKWAASLAFNIENFREVERMVGLGLAGNPPEPIYSELKELLESTKTVVPSISPTEKYQILPIDLQKEVADFIDFLMLRNGVEV